ncbi:MAG: hypothetical protein ACPGID_03210 [Rubricella sp.]
MTRTQGVLLDILTPVRDIFLSRLLEEMADALERGFECDTDVVRRDERGDLYRSGPLHLPERYDLATDAGRERATFDVEDSLVVRFDPMNLTLSNGAPVTILPFQWNAVVVAVDLEEGKPDWGGVRRWYLENFQSRFDEDTPEFHGAIHRLQGPEGGPRSWRMTLDLGTASVDCLADLLEAFAVMGAQRVSLSGAEEETERVDAT